MKAVAGLDMKFGVSAVIGQAKGAVKMGEKRHVINNIKCEVKNCVYQTPEQRCTAGEIEIGTRNAKDCSETACITFELDKHANC
ncbi:MAG TPA: DUF1540 domain-containing protein [Clostridiales bacterium]|nr:DUF1540 domain-containing protein [Clostridiales bacterium]HOL78552.1 DUF1540 domain-containing protein [Clostridiales bacterium]HPU66864.1 DUF1540 domain-containing protein [Clostridiales bacterium]HQD72704.1 DUF1540 domain-containing protein [Clostridiales bacterium]